MGLFTTQAAWEQKCSGLQARIDELEADALAHDTAITELQTELAEAKEANATFPSSDAIAAIEKERDTALAAAAPERISAAAIAIINGTGGTEAQRTEVSRLIASRVTEQLASAGQPEPVEEKEEKEVSPGLTGLARTTAAFNRGRK